MTNCSRSGRSAHLLFCWRVSNLNVSSVMKESDAEFLMKSRVRRGQCFNILIKMLSLSAIAPYSVNSFKNSVCRRNESRNEDWKYTSKSCEMASDDRLGARR